MNSQNIESIAETRKILEVELEGVAAKIVKNVEEFATSDVENWKIKMYSIAKNYDILLSLDKIQREMPNNITNDIEHWKSPNDFHMNIKRKVDEMLEKSSNDSALRKIKGVFGDTMESSEDDIAIVGMAEVDTSYVCPFTGKLFEIPMKNEGCIHHISKIGLQAMLHNKRAARCPVAGCSALWTLSSSSVDEIFAYKVEKFKKRKGGANLRRNGSQQASQATFVGLDDVDE